MRDVLIESIQDIILRDVKDKKLLSSSIGKRHSTLMRELNPYDNSAKLGIETFISIVRKTRNKNLILAILQYSGMESYFKEA